MRAARVAAQRKHFGNNKKAQKMQDALAGFFAEFDAILAPVAPGQAPRDLARTGSAIFNGYWTLMGAPAASLPLLDAVDWSTPCRLSCNGGCPAQS